MPLQTAFYNIRSVPKGVELPFTGGLYATADNLNIPIRAEPLAHPASSAQTWVIKAVAGKRHTYTIHAMITPAGMDVGFGRADGGSVVLTPQIAEWEIAQDSNEDNGIYNIRVPSVPGMTGATHAVVEKNDTLCIDSYAVVQHRRPFDRWQFVLAHA